MTIVEKKPVPIYESVCPECKSVFRYKAVEAEYMHVNCPICGMPMWASTLPIGMDGDGDA